MITLLVPPGTLGEEPVDVELEPEEVRHLKARRAQAGDRIRLLDGMGHVAHGTVLGHTRVRIGKPDRVECPPRLLLAVGAGDKERFAWLVEKAGELAVTDVIPLDTERSRAVAGGVGPRHLDRLQRRARQAITQSGAAWAPVVHRPIPLGELGSVATGSRWLADIGGATPGRAERDITVVIGAEGGWAPAERAWLEQAGFSPVRLAADTLRFETAAIAAATIVALRRREASR